MATAGMKKGVGVIVSFTPPESMLPIAVVYALRADIDFCVPGISYYAASNVVRVEEYEELINRGWRR